MRYVREASWDIDNETLASEFMVHSTIYEDEGYHEKLRGTYGPRTSLMVVAMSSTRNN